MNIYLNGNLFQADRPLIDVTNPANGKIIDTVPDMTEEDIDLAVAAAREAFAAWGKESQRNRSDIIET